MISWNSSRRPGKLYLAKTAPATSEVTRHASVDDHRDADAVEEEAGEGRRLEDAAIVGPGRRLGQQLRRPDGDLCRRLEGGGEHPQHRQHHEQRARHQDAMDQCHRQAGRRPHAADWRLIAQPPAPRAAHQAELDQREAEDDHGQRHRLGRGVAHVEILEARSGRCRRPARAPPGPARPASPASSHRPG